MAQTVEDICNLMLAALKADMITDINSAGIAAQLCKLVLPEMRDAELRAHAWNVSTRFATIAADGTTPPFKYARRYPLPNGPENVEAGSPAYCLRVLRINGEARWKKRWRIMGRHLYTNEGPGAIELEYSGRVENIQHYDPLLVQAIALRCGNWLAFRFSGSASLKEAIQRDYAILAEQARQVDAMEGYPDEEDDDLAPQPWDEARL